MKQAIIVSYYDWYEGRLKEVSNLLSNYGYNVVILISDFNHLKKKHVDERREQCRYIHVPAYKKNVSARRVYSHLAYARAVNRVLKDIKPDLVYALVPPNGVGEVCRRFKNDNADAKLIVDIIDLWPESLLGAEAEGMLAKRWASLRERCLIHADYVFTECDLYKTIAIPAENNAKTSTLYLYRRTNLSRDEVLSLTNLHNENTGVLTFGYLGSINNIIDIEGICELLTSFVAAGFEIRVKIIGDGEGKDRFIKYLKEAGCKTEYYGIIYDESSKFNILKVCDYGLNMMKESVAVGLTIKSVDYLSMGIPIINNIKADTWNLVASWNIGFNVCKDITLEDVYMIANADNLKLRKQARDCFEFLFTEEAFDRQLKHGLERAL